MTFPGADGNVTILDVQEWNFCDQQGEMNREVVTDHAEALICM